MAEAEALHAPFVQGASKACAQSKFRDRAHLEGGRHVTSRPLIYGSGPAKLKAIVASPAVSSSFDRDARVTSTQSKASAPYTDEWNAYGRVFRLATFSPAKLRIEILAKTGQRFTVANTRMGAPCANGIGRAHMFEGGVRDARGMTDLTHRVVSPTPQRRVPAKQADVSTADGHLNDIVDIETKGQRAVDTFGAQLTKAAVPPAVDLAVFAQAACVPRSAGDLDVAFADPLGPRRELSVAHGATVAQLTKAVCSPAEDLSLDAQ
ncbi:MAG: hypothetical protein ACI9KE_002760 [Polyangiales bacterium]|jgi:hypothetical protein